MRVQFQATSVRDPTYFTLDPGTLAAYRAAIAGLVGTTADRVTILVQSQARRRRLLATTTLTIMIGTNSTAQSVAVVDALAQGALNAALYDAGLASVTIVPGTMAVVDLSGGATSSSAAFSTASANSNTTTAGAVIVVPTPPPSGGGGDGSSRFSYAPAPPPPPPLRLLVALAVLAVWLSRSR
jgi:hypothetical protein